MEKHYYVYIMSNHWNTVFYTGVTNNLIRRVYEHKNKLVEGFTKRYKIDELLYFEESADPRSAIEREKQIKDYRRSKKLELIEKMNPHLIDLYNDLL